MPDIFDEIAERVSERAYAKAATHEDESASAHEYADAFREHFAARTCLTCRYFVKGGCEKVVRYPVDPATFSCSLWEVNA
jgi:hypothetical protein